MAIRRDWSQSRAIRSRYSRCRREIDAAADVPAALVGVQRLLDHQVVLVELELVSIVRRERSVVVRGGIVGIAGDSHVQPTVDVDAGAAEFADHSVRFSQPSPLRPSLPAWPPRQPWRGLSGVGTSQPPAAYRFEPPRHSAGVVVGRKGQGILSHSTRPIRSPNAMPAIITDRVFIIGCPRVSSPRDRTVSDCPFCYRPRSAPRFSQKSVNPMQSAKTAGGKSKIVRVGQGSGLAIS